MIMMMFPLSVFSLDICCGFLALLDGEFGW